jgi:hypothetical protein
VLNGKDVQPMAGRELFASDTPNGARRVESMKIP